MNSHESAPAGKHIVRIVLSAAAVSFILFAAASCTEYERAGRNPRPFNEPVSWEVNPYPEAFRN